MQNALYRTTRGAIPVVTAISSSGVANHHVRNKMIVLLFPVVGSTVDEFKIYINLQHLNFKKERNIKISLLSS